MSVVPAVLNTIIARVGCKMVVQPGLYFACVRNVFVVCCTVGLFVLALTASASAPIRNGEAAQDDAEQSEYVFKLVLSLDPDRLNPDVGDEYACVTSASGTFAAFPIRLISPYEEQPWGSWHYMEDEKYDTCFTVSDYNFDGAPDLKWESPSSGIYGISDYHFWLNSGNGRDYVYDPIISENSGYLEMDTVNKRMSFVVGCHYACSSTWEYELFDGQYRLIHHNQTSREGIVTRDDSLAFADGEWRVVKRWREEFPDFEDRYLELGDEVFNQTCLRIMYVSHYVDGELQLTNQDSSYVECPDF